MWFIKKKKIGFQAEKNKQESCETHIYQRIQNFQQLETHGEVDKRNKKY